MTHEKALNPLLATVKLPGRSFQLPSGGALYNNGELAGDTGEIHVQALSALDEITLKNPDLLFSGQALTQIIHTCVTGIKDPTALYGRDIDALMIFLRLVTYGPAFAIKVAHDCKQSQYPLREGETVHRHKDHEYNVDIEAMAQSMKPLDPTDVLHRYTVTLDNGQVVTVSPVRYRDLIELYHDTLAHKEKFTVDDAKEAMIKNLVMVIDNVDGITDKAMIAEWAKQLSTKQTNTIGDIIANTTDWGPDNVATLVCEDCGEEFKVELPLNPISFFTE